MSRLAGTVALLACAWALAAQAPPAGPQVSSIFPSGGARGSEVEIELRGSHLEGASGLLFVTPGIQGTILASEAALVRARVGIGAEVETGRHDFRLLTPRGAWLGVLQAGPMPEQRETEPNDAPASAPVIALPALINGTADAADADHFRFRAKAGETLVFDVHAARGGSALDPVVAVLDASGAEIAYCDDFYTSRDARLVHTFKKAGEYIVRVSASFERSGPHAPYRLLVTGGAYAASSLPLGGRRGSTAEVRVSGWNLGTVDRAWLAPTGPPATLEGAWKAATVPQAGSAVRASFSKAAAEAKAAILARRPGEVRLRLRIPQSLAAGRYQLHLAAGRQELPQPLPFMVSDLPELTAAAGPRPQPVATPVIVNGALPGTSDHLARSQAFEFTAAAGGRYEFLVESWELGMRLDPVLTLYDGAGAVLAQEDDPAPNSFIHHPASHDPCLVYEFAKPGRYRIAIRDAAYQGGPGAVYRLLIREARPGFEVKVRAPQVTVEAGKSGTLLAVVERTGGVHKVEPFLRPDSEIENYRILEGPGWQAPVSVWIEGLPPGVSSSNMMAEPKNTIFKGNDGEELFVNGTLVELPLKAAAETAAGLYEIRVRARGTFAGQTVERRGRVLHGSRGLRAELTQDQKLWLNVVKP